jgi:hypothetical protein
MTNLSRVAGRPRRRMAAAPRPRTWLGGRNNSSGTYAAENRLQRDDALMQAAARWSPLANGDKTRHPMRGLMNWLV